MSDGRADELRSEIRRLTGEYYREKWGEETPFQPGESYLAYGGRVFDDAELEALVDASLDFWLTYGPYSERFERELGAFLGLRHCLLVNSGSSANLLAFMALTSEKLGERRVRRGDEVITVAAGFPTTVAPIVQFGAVPVFVDVRTDTANVDVQRLEEAIGPRTRAVILAHTLGNPFDIETVVRLCEQHGLWLIEDNCDSLGSSYGGVPTGSFGHIGTSSFYPPHHMTMGEGGAVYTDDAELASILASLRDWGRDCICRSGEDDRCGRRFARQFGTLPFGYDHKYVFSEFGYNLKATEMQAAIGCAQLLKLPEFTRVRRANHETLRRHLADAADVLQVQEPTPGSRPSWFGLLVTLTAEAKAAGLSRDAVVARLEGARIQTRMLFAGNMVRQPCFDAMREAPAGSAAFRVVGDLAATDRIMEDAFWVGVYPGLDEQKLAYIAGELLAACRRPGR
ncbi:MAG TPA: lipopolysaccharide biosynthesis protein RfbH [Thermoleophilia bacterium]|nr:lipopolysaccharide biosynthesis protein RfbH [Thermoleophilia bacterium]